MMNKHGKHNPTNVISNAVKRRSTQCLLYPWVDSITQFLSSHKQKTNEIYRIFFRVLLLIRREAVLMSTQLLCRFLILFFILYFLFPGERFVQSIWDRNLEKKCEVENKKNKQSDFLSG